MSTFYYLARKPWIFFFFSRSLFLFAFARGLLWHSGYFLRIEVYSINPRGFFFFFQSEGKKKIKPPNINLFRSINLKFICSRWNADVVYFLLFQKKKTKTKPKTTSQHNVSWLPWHVQEEGYF